MHVPFRFLDQYEEQELWTPFAFPINRHYPGAPARAMSTFAAYSSLAVIIVSRASVTSIVKRASNRTILEQATIHLTTGTHDHAGVHRSSVTRLPGGTAAPLGVGAEPLGSESAVGDRL